MCERERDGVRERKHTITPHAQLQRLQLLFFMANIKRRKSHGRNHGSLGMGEKDRGRRPCDVLGITSRLYQYLKGHFAQGSGLKSVESWRPYAPICERERGGKGSRVCCSAEHSC